GSAIQGTQRAGPARSEPGENRVPAVTGQALGVPVLFGPLGAARGYTCEERTGSLGRARRLLESAGKLSGGGLTHRRPLFLAEHAEQVGNEENHQYGSQS